MAVALTAVAGTGTAAVSALAESSQAQLSSFICQTALDPAERAMSITAVMRPVPETMKMALRFELLKRTKRSGRSVSLSGVNLRNWVTPSNPTLGSRPGDRWIVKHPVVDLGAPAWYRYKVTFRWTGAHGRVISEAVRESAQCYQPELRADLKVTSIVVHPIPGHPAVYRFVGTIRNTGRTASGPFQVEFADGPNGPLSPQFKPVAQLLPHHQVALSFKGPTCSAAARATIIADPTHQVDDVNPNDNSLSTTCSSLAQRPPLG